MPHPVPCGKEVIDKRPNLETQLSDGCGHDFAPSLRCSKELLSPRCSETQGAAGKGSLPISSKIWHPARVEY